MIRPLTDHEYQINGGVWVTCSIENTTDNGDGSYTIHDGLNVNIPIGQLKVRVKSIGINPVSSALQNAVAFTIVETIDSDVSAYLAAAGINDEDTYTEILLPGSLIKSAVNTLITGIKAVDGLYDKMRYLWLFNGADATANCLDFKLTKSLILNTTSGHSNPIFTSKGIEFDGGNYADTGVKTSDFTDRKLSLGAYVTNQEQFVATIGIYTSAGEGMLGGLSGDRAFGGSTGTGFGGAPGLSTVNVLSDSLYTFYRAGVKIKTGATGSQNDAPLLAMNYWVGALNFDGAPLSGGAASQNRVVFIADGLTDDENVALNDLFNDYCLTLRKGITRKFTFFGDSITSGTGADSSLTRWTTQLCNTKKYTEINCGSGGSKVSDWVSSLAASNLKPYNSDYDEGLLIALGTNDCNTSVPTSDVTSGMISLINLITAQGWPVDKIYVNLPFYENVAGNSISKLQTYVDAIQAACDDRGVTNTVDSLATMINNGQDALISPDGIHPNQDGHNVIASAWEDYLS